MRIKDVISAVDQTFELQCCDTYLVCRAGLWHGHYGQRPRAYDVEGAFETWPQNIFNVR